MTAGSLFVAWLLTAVTTVGGKDLELLRAGYGRVSEDKELCKELLERLSSAKQKSTTERGYLGALQTIWANHVFSPLEKLRTFSEGRKTLERAIGDDPANPELRFLRLSIQKNVPVFLGYKGDIREDTEFLKRHRHRIKSTQVQDYIDAL